LSSIRAFCSLKISSGDSLIKLARQAILQYSTENDVTLTGNQTNYASYSTAAYFNEKSSLKPGETVTFDKKVIEGSIELAKEKWKTVATL